MRLNPIALILWGILFLGGYLFISLHAGLVALFCGMVLSLVVTAFQS